MFRKSILIVIIQAIGIVLGLFSVYFVAGDMPPEIYSLMGVSTIMTGVLTTFSHLGIETKMMREALYWEEKKEFEKVKEYATQAILSRFLGITILTPFILSYILYLSHHQYNGDYKILLILFFFGSCCNALNDSLSLIVRSKGEYVFAQMAKMLNSDLVKFVAILMFKVFGSMPYLYFICVAPLPLLIIFIVKTKKIFRFEYVNIRSTITKIKDTRFLWYKTDLEYFKNYADSLLVSVLFTPAILGSYTIYKTFENIAKSFVEGFFDVLSQSTVRYKCNYEVLVCKEKKIRKIAYLLSAIVGLFAILFFIYSSRIIQIINLSNYQDIDLMVLCVCIVTICYLIGKYESNAIAFFATSKLNFKISIATSIVALLSFVSVAFMPTIEIVLLQRIFIYLFTSIISIIYLNKYRNKLYNNNLK